jgi:TolB-like protein
MSESNDNNGWSQFVAEVRRRRVVRFALAYAAAAFVVLQLAEIVFPAFGIGEAGLRLLVIVTTLAFPPALVLAWIYDLTREGIRRTEGGPGGPLIHRVALAALLVATMGATGGMGLYLARQGFDPAADTAPGTVAVQAATFDPGQPIRSIAVLPLDDFSPGSDQAYFTASMHEELIAKLSMLDELRVVSRTSVMRYEDTTLDMPTIGRELNVDVIVEGSVTRTPERTRVTLQLIHAPSDSHIETLQWDREEVTDVLAFQTEIAQDVVEEVGGQYDTDVLTTASNPVVPAAQDAYFRGRYEYERDTPEGYRAAMEYFTEAVSEDPDFAPALAGLAGARFLIEVDRGDVDSEEVAQAHEEALAAIELDPASTEAREVLTLIERSLPELAGVSGTIPAPTAGSKEVHVLTLPGGTDSIVVDRHAFDTAWVSAMTSLGERIEAKVRRLTIVDDPTGSALSRETLRARQYVTAGRYAEASELLEDVVREDPAAGRAWELLLRSRVALSDLDGALRVASAWSRSGAEGAPTSDEVQALDGSVQRDGTEGYWAWTLGRLQRRDAAGERVARMELATAHAALGQADEAFDYLVDALENGEPGVIALRSDPAWDRVRSEPEFRQLGREAQRLLYSRPPPPGAPPRR